MTLRVVVAEDEPLAAAALARELERLGCTVVAVTGTGGDALAACLAHRPQLCVTDVAMPGRDGLAVARALRAAAPEIRVVFVTAHPQYAVDAFAEEVLDFVPKPVRRDRLAEAISRVQRAVSGGGDEPRLVVGERGARQVLAVRDLEWVQADGATLWLHTPHRAWAVRERMQQMDDRLAPLGFVRVHRSALVRVGAIRALVAGDEGETLIELRSGTRVRVARDRVAAVRAALDDPSGATGSDGGAA